MTSDPDRHDLDRYDGAPRSRVAQQQRTRDALLQAATRSFARDGFHGASLDAIAREAGYSKGAVYSNFAGKAELFLAAMDVTVTVVEDPAWDPTVRLTSRAELDAMRDVAFDDPPTELQIARGFALATLEFVSSAGRDERLTGALRERLRLLVDSYRRAVGRERDEHDPVTEDELALLLAALDQGFGLFLLLGWPVEDTRLLQRGLRRMLRPPDDEAPD